MVSIMPRMLSSRKMSLLGGDGTLPCRSSLLLDSIRVVLYPIWGIFRAKMAETPKSGYLI